MLVGDEEDVSVTALSDKGGDEDGDGEAEEKGKGKSMYFLEDRVDF